MTCRRSVAVIVLAVVLAGCARPDGRLPAPAPTTPHPVSTGSIDSGPTEDQSEPAAPPRRPAKASTLRHQREKAPVPLPALRPVPRR